jgi:hypothetical protein
MGRPSHLEIYKYLKKSNCKECGVPTCLAFAAAVMKGEKRLDLCPHIARENVQQLEARMGPRPECQDDRGKALEALRAQISSVDFSERVEKLGASLAEGVLTVRCLGKNFGIDSVGFVRTDCHTTPWLIIPLFHYILHGAGRPLMGKWVPLKDLKGGTDWYRLFGQRCEKPLRKLVNDHTDLFEIIIDIFGGEALAHDAEADISIVIHPLPKVPVLIRYWKPEGDFESALSLLFDATADDNLGIEALYTLCVGLVIMFEKISLTHDKGV